MPTFTVPQSPSPAPQGAEIAQTWQDSDATNGLRDGAHLTLMPQINYLKVIGEWPPEEDPVMRNNGRFFSIAKVIHPVKLSRRTFEQLEVAVFELVRAIVDEEVATVMDNNPERVAVHVRLIQSLESEVTKLKEALKEMENTNAENLELIAERDSVIEDLQDLWHGESVTGTEQANLEIHKLREDLKQAYRRLDQYRDQLRYLEVSGQNGSARTRALDEGNRGFERDSYTIPGEELTQSQPRRPTQHVLRKVAADLAAAERLNRTTSSRILEYPTGPSTHHPSMIQRLRESDIPRSADMPDSSVLMDKLISARHVIDDQMVCFGSMRSRLESIVQDQALRLAQAESMLFYQKTKAGRLEEELSRIRSTGVRRTAF